jgi:hypothetical protein
MTDVEFIYEKYKAFYGFPQGKCGQIAEEIQAAIGGEIVAGVLDGGYFQRNHWWVEKDGVIIDPMSDELAITDPHKHVEKHRDLSRAYWK